jgi:hypothetical protein
MARVARNIRDLLMEFDGLWITPDFSLKQDVKDVSEQQRRFRRVVAAATERTMYNNAFDSDEQLLAFFDGLGLQPRVLNAVDAAPNIVSLDVLNLSHQILDTAKSKLRLWVLSVDHAHQWAAQLTLKSCILTLPIFGGTSGCEKYLLWKRTGFLTRLSVTNGKLSASQASMLPTSGRTLVMPLTRSSSATRALVASLGDEQWRPTSQSRAAAQVGAGNWQIAATTYAVRHCWLSMAIPFHLRHGELIMDNENSKPASKVESAACKLTSF